MASLSAEARPASHPALYYLFGLPATGKTYVGRLLEEKFGFRFYDADEWLPSDMLQTLKDGRGFSDAQRDMYYTLICDKIEQRIAVDKVPVVIAQATFKNKHRLQVLKRFPFVQFWWVQAPVQRRAKRLKDRSDGNGSLLPGSKAASSEWCDENDKNFEPPSNRIKHVVFVNGSDCTSEAGKAELCEAVSLVLKKQGDEEAANTGAGISKGMVHTGPSALTRVRSYSGTLDAGRNFDVGTALGIDIGGSLAKLVIFEPDETKYNALKHLTGYVNQQDSFGETGRKEKQLSFQSSALGGRFHFVSFETSHMQGAIELIKARGLNQYITKLYATGGGAQKFKSVFKDIIGIDIIPLDELGTIVKALSFLVSQNPQEIYQLEGLDTKHTASSVKRVPLDLGDQQLYPYMLCNIGSGVSILHVIDEKNYKRVSGTALGGGTFFGLAKLLTKLKSFNECMEEAAVGDETTVNMLVKDIYGGRYGLELPGDFTASFFGKVGGSTNETDKPKHDDSATAETSPPPANADLCRALVVMITQNIAQIALLNAVIYGCPRVIFTGNFLRMNPIATRTLAYATKRWSESSSRGHSVQANFLWHEGHLGAIGSFLENLDLEYFLQNQRKRKSPSLDTTVREERLKKFQYKS